MNLTLTAVLLAHGFGGSKRSVADDAAQFADRGYAVLAYSAQGMGNSGGLIHLNSPDYEIRDAQRLLDWLATRPEIQLDGPGDPRVGAVGGSYGGSVTQTAAPSAGASSCRRIRASPSATVASAETMIGSVVIRPPAVSGW